MSQHVPPAPSAPTAPRGRVRRFLPLSVAAWLVVEIWLLTVVASATSWFAVLLLLLGGLVLGAWLVKRAGLKAISAAIEQSRQPQSQQPQTGTSMTVLAGMLLMFPGFLSDVLGLSLLFPPTRALWRVLGRRFTSTALRSTAPVGADRLADAVRLQEQIRIHRPDGKVIQGEVVDPAQPSGPSTDYRPPID
ncbi:FxsA family membrane protein [Kitasatospora sp. CMC57]|uniref:FxsA family membrane protein n=1 Tax=Kitasatospora sp. CMC57 TaxID=3231513 RepID=UPI0038B54662